MKRHEPTPVAVSRQKTDEVLAGRTEKLAAELASIRDLEEAAKITSPDPDDSWRSPPEKAYKALDTFIADSASLRDLPPGPEKQQRLFRFLESSFKAKIMPDLNQSNVDINESSCSYFVEKYISSLGEIVEELNKGPIDGEQQAACMKMLGQMPVVMDKKERKIYRKKEKGAPISCWDAHIIVYESDSDYGEGFTCEDQFLSRLLSVLGKGPKDVRPELSKLFSRSLITDVSFITPHSIDAHKRKGSELSQDYFIEIRARIEQTFAGLEVELSETRLSLFKQLFSKQEIEKMDADLLLDWAIGTFESIKYLPQTAEALRKGDQAYIRRRLKEVLQQEKREHPAQVAWCLMRMLDEGDIALTEEGMEFAGQVYDLGEKNDPAYVARRLTSNGKVAVFDPNRTMVGYFEATPPKDEKIAPGLEHVDEDDLFLPKAKLTSEEQLRRQEGVKRYETELYSYMGGELFDKTGMFMADLSLFEQEAVMEMLRENPEQRREIFHILHFHKQYGARALIQVGQRDPERLQKVKEISSHHFVDSHRLFEEYGRFVEFTQLFHERISPLLQERLKGEFDAEQWLGSLYAKGSQFIDALSELHKKIETSDRQSQAREYTKLSHEEVMRQVGLASPEKTLSSCAQAMIQQVAVDLANAFQAEELKGVLHELPGAVAGPLIAYLQPETPGETKEDLKRLYEGITFETYALNKQMAPREIAFLHDKLPKGKPVLDAGCGTGRLLVPLAKLGFDIHGLDFTPRHVDLVRNQLAQDHLDASRVQQGDWLATGYPDRSFEAVTCLGRGIMHEYRIERQRKFFAEMNRILAQDGRLIIDIPDHSIPHSHYDQLVRGYRTTMNERGIFNTRSGTIFDSPDGKNFATRYAYDENDIRILAHEAGFEVVEKTEEDLPTGFGDKNIYFVLKKVSDLAEELPMAA